MSLSQTYSQKSDQTAHREKPLRVLVGLSGGIYSAVTAALLKTQGHDVVGLHLELGVPEGLAKEENHCATGNSKEQAEKVAKTLGIELHTLDVRDLYQFKVVDPVIHAAVLGRVPSACMSCNREIKIASLFSKLADYRCDKVATGHGAQVIVDPRTGLAHLHQAIDAVRDQSYMLFTLGQEELKQILMPLGNFPKHMVSRLAAEHGFLMGDIPAQSLCFKKSRKGVAFLESKIAPSLRPPGVIRTATQVLGDHQGLLRFNVGDKPQIEVSSADITDLVVTALQVSDHSLVLGTRDQLLKKEAVVTGAHWIQPMNELKGMKAFARLSSQGGLVACQVTLFENQTLRVEFAEPQGPLSPGQAIVFYQENEVLGGAWIRSTS